jgi:hypothetical protein
MPFVSPPLNHATPPYKPPISPRPFSLEIPELQLPGRPRTDLTVATISSEHREHEPEVPAPPFALHPLRHYAPPLLIPFSHAQALQNKLAMSLELLHRLGALAAPHRHFGKQETPKFMLLSSPRPPLHHRIISASWETPKHRRGACLSRRRRVVLRPATASHRDHPAPSDPRSTREIRSSTRRGIDQPCAAAWNAKSAASSAPRHCLASAQ